MFFLSAVPEKRGLVQHRQIWGRFWRPGGMPALPCRIPCRIQSDFGETEPGEASYGRRENTNHKEYPKGTPRPNVCGKDQNGNRNEDQKGPNGYQKSTKWKPKGVRTDQMGTQRDQMGPQFGPGYPECLGTPRAWGPLGRWSSGVRFCSPNPTPGIPRGGPFAGWVS